jgi:DNA-binding NarL/FixJ family response regulator
MGKSVLIVEDEFLIAYELRLLLESHGWSVIGPAPNVRTALALLQETRPSVALLDVNLGTELVTPVALALKDMGIPFALASAYSRPEDYGGEVLRDAPNAGKPTSDQQVLAALAQISAA